MKTITNVIVSDVEKRRHPSKHYVYVIIVKWSDGGQYVVYRRYSRFFDLQSTLLDKFPIEAGTVEPTQRILPILPGKILFGRSHIREVAMKRLQPIDEYCKSLIAMPANISQCEEVLSFFEVEDEDLDPPTSEEKHKKEPKANKISKPKQLKQYLAVSDYVKQERGEIDLRAGAVVELVEQSESGWWFVNGEDEQGWVPSTYLQPTEGTKEDTTRRANPGEEEKYICIDAFTSHGNDEISLEKGAIVEVVEKNMEGWWLVRHQGKEGWAPATYLCKTRDNKALCLAERGRASGVEIISKLSDISELMKQDDSCISGKPHDKEEVCKSVGHMGDLYSKVNKAKSLERGGSLRPPPRQNSVEPKAGVGSSSVPSTKSATSYLTVADFNDSVGDGISFKAGETVMVHEKAAGGWWYVEICGQEGWAPSSYIQPSTSQNQALYDDVKPSNDIGDMRDISASKPTPPPKKKPGAKPSVLPRQAPNINSTAVSMSGKTDTFGIADVLRSKSELKQTNEKTSSSASSKCISSTKPMLPSRLRGEASTSRKEDQGDGVMVTKLLTVPAPREEVERQALRRPHTIIDKPTPPAKLPSKICSPGQPPAAPPKALNCRPQLPLKPKASDSNNNKESSYSDVPNVHGITAALKSKFEHTGSTSNLPKPRFQPEPHGKSSPGFAQSLASKFDNLNTGTTFPQKPKLPVKKTSVKSGSSVHSAKNTIEESNYKQKQAELKSVHASGNVSGLICALGNQLNFDERPDPGQRRSWTLIDNKVDPPAYHRSVSPVAIFPETGKTNIINITNSQTYKDRYTTVAKFTGGGENEATVEDREVVEVLDKSDDSWWLVKKKDGQEGYVPSSYLEQNLPTPKPSSLPSRAVYKTVCMFTAENEGEVGFDEGDIVDVIEKTDEGWWMVRVSGGKQGWAPSDFITEE